MRDTRGCLVATALVALVTGCSKPPSFVVEVPEAGASVDVSGWLFEDQDPTGQLWTRPIFETVGEGRVRLNKQAKFGAEANFKQGKLPHPYVRIHEMKPRPKAQNTLEPWTLDTCAEAFRERDAYGTVAWNAGPAEAATVNGLSVRRITIDSTSAEMTTERRSHVLALSKNGSCFAIEATTTIALLGDQEASLKRVLDSVKPL